MNSDLVVRRLVFLHTELEQKNAQMPSNIKSNSEQSKQIREDEAKKI
jgi:hypothetical protein